MKDELKRVIHSERDMVCCNGMMLNILTETPNKETIEAMNETDRLISDPKMKFYTDVDILMKELLS